MFKFGQGMHDLTFLLLSKFDDIFKFIVNVYSIMCPTRKLNPFICFNVILTG